MTTQDSKQKLAAILSRDAEMRGQQDREKAEREARVGEAHRLWGERVEKEIVPGLQPLVKMLTDAGWLCDLTRTPAGFKVAVYRGDMRAYGARERPYLLLEAQRGYDSIAVTEGLPNSVGQVQGLQMTASSATLDQISGLLTDLVENLAMK